MMSGRPEAINRKKLRQTVSSARNYWEAVTKEHPSNTRYLISRLDSSSLETFPFEHALSFYLLFIAALWPNDNDRIVMASRIFAGLLNHYIAALSQNQVTSVSDPLFDFHNHFSRQRLASFNETFFKEIGGAYSLLFTDSVTQFHADVLKRVSALQMMHDVINFLMRASVVSPQLSSSRIAFEAVATNLFRRPHGYGIHSGAKRKRSTESATTVNSVREKWKKTSDTVLLSFLMTQMLDLQDLPLADPRKFFVDLQTMAKPAGRFITVMLRILQRDLTRSLPAQNKSIQKWTRILPPTRFRGGIGGALTFSDDELERVFKLCEKIKKLTEEQKIQFRNNNKNALYDLRADDGLPKVKSHGRGKNRVSVL